MKDAQQSLLRSAESVEAVLYLGALEEQHANPQAQSGRSRP